jgi:catechol 2,3-dioxygenase-like lactoylglutathione lyase family enzyme
MKAFLLACGLLVAVAVNAAAQTAAAQTTTAASLASMSTQPSMNVFRRFAVDRAKMIAFYGDVLGLKPMAPINMPGGGQMIRFQVGTSEIKLQATPGATEFKSGPIGEVTGLRVFTFFFPDEAALTARFVKHGHPAPEFKKGRGDKRVAMVLDPENQWVELVVVPGAPPATFDALEVGLTVSDLEKSRAFYRDFIGLEELPPVKDELLGVTRYPFRHGTTTVNVWSFGKGLAANTRSAGIQYVTSNVVAVDEKAKAMHVKIDTPLGNFSAALRTIWLSDPDGVTNYFAQIVRQTPATR